jgi:hypothetical protein
MFRRARGSTDIQLPFAIRKVVMSINTEREIEANMQIGPTDAGMVRIFIESQGIEVPMDFDPEEAEEIAEEIRSAAAQARVVAAKKR